MFSSEYNSVIFSKIYWVGGGKYENILKKKYIIPPPPSTSWTKKLNKLFWLIDVSWIFTGINHMSVYFRYTPQTIELDHKLKPFIPDFIPAVGDIDAFLKVRDNFQIWTVHECPIFSFWMFLFNAQVPRPDGEADNLGLLVLDEPCTKQSDPTVLSLWLSENSKQHNVAVSSHMRARRLTVLRLFWPSKWNEKVMDISFTGSESKEHWKPREEPESHRQLDREY